MSQQPSQSHPNIQQVPTWKAWILATRPKTLTAAVVPVFIGTLLAIISGSSISWYLALHALMAAICIQVGTNFINDALDFKKGADTKTRIGPQRVTQSGLLTMRQVYLGGWAFFALAVLFGIPLIMEGGWPLLVILIVSVAFGYLYTGGPMPLAYVGLGDLFVFLFFGLVSTAAVCYIQTGAWENCAWLAGAQIGLLATVLIAINNLRDQREDGKVGKNTLAVRFGVRFARWEITSLLFLPFVFSFGWISLSLPYLAWLPWTTLPLAVTIARKVWTIDPSPIYNQFLAKAALLHMAFGIMLAIGILLSL